MKPIVFKSASLEQMRDDLRFGRNRACIDWHASSLCAVLVEDRICSRISTFRVTSSLDNIARSDFRFGVASCMRRTKFSSRPKVPCLNIGYVPRQFDHAGDPLRQSRFGSVVLMKTLEQGVSSYELFSWACSSLRFDSMREYGSEQCCRAGTPKE